MIKICVFDMDGTTVNTLKTIALHSNTILKQNGIQSFPIETYKTFIGAGALNMFRAIQKETGFPDEKLEEMKDEWIRRYGENCLELTEAYSGIKEMFISLNNAGIKCAILTNKYYTLAEQITEKLFPGGVVSRVIGDHPGASLKPDPTELLKLLNEFGIRPEDCLYAGDTPIDILTGKRAGCYTCGVSWGYRSVESLIEAGADTIVYSPSQIVRICSSEKSIMIPETIKYSGGKRLVCFDLDGTLTEHRSPLEEGNRSLLNELKRKYKLLMVGAGNCERIYKQMGNYPIDIIGNYGMQESTAETGSFKVTRVDKSYPNKEYFESTCFYLRKKYGYLDYSGEPLEFHSSGMVTFPLLGTKAKIEDKLIFDPDRAKRRKMYSEVMALFPDYSVYIGGSSSFDFTGKSYNKYDAILRYAKEHGFEDREILFVGDDFEEGGGDSHVRIGGLDYVKITCYRDAAKQLAFLLQQ